MGTSAERTRALRERERRGIRTFTIGVTEDDLRMIAEHGYEAATSTDHDQQTRTVSLFITNMLTRRLESAKNNGVTRVATAFQ